MLSNLMAIPPQFDQADSFSEGLARVRIGDKWGYIDQTGQFVISPQFDEANSFSEGVALVQHHYTVGENLVIPQNGKIRETRGIWITTTDSRVLYSRANIAEAMDFLAETGFNVVFPVVWTNGATIYPSQIMRENFGVEIDPRFVGRNPLEEIITEAKRVGLAVIPWFEYGFASSYNQNGGRILAKKTEWAARDIKGNLLKKNKFEWMNALDREVQDFLLSLMLEVAEKYEVAGIQGDDRLPALPSHGGYDAKTRDRYFRQFNQYPPTHYQDAQWLQWRADILTDFLTRLYRELITLNPNLIISMAPNVYPWALQEYLQDSQSWIDQGLVDLIHPALYRRDFESYKQLVDRLITEQFKSSQLSALVPGILLKVGSYRISEELLLQKIQYNRDRQIQGEVFFFYEGLRENNNALAKALRQTFYAQTLPFNTPCIKAQGFTYLRIESQYSYINRSGQPINSIHFDCMSDFNQGLATAKNGYKWAYIDKNLTRASRFEFDECELFSEGLALVKKGNRYGYINQNFQLIISCHYDEAKSFHEGLAAVRIRNQWFYINKKGKAILILDCDEADNFTEGMARIKQAGKSGYINKTANFFIPAQFDEADAFQEGLARVKIGKKWGYINSIGRTIIDFQFDEAESFAEGLAAIKIDELWGYVNPEGKLVIAPQFSQAKPFREGLAAVELNNRWGYMHKSLS
jgi:uncharacterized lipoprotein YddW (UPF0748 family)